MTELREALNFINSINEKKLSIEYEEFSTAKGRENYAQILELIQKTDSKPQELALYSLDSKIVFDLSEQILKLIFSSVIGEPNIRRMMDDIRITGGNNPFEGYVYKEGDRNYICIECANKVACIPTITHEGTHQVTLPTTYTPNYHHTEVLPILVELITSIILDEMHIGDNNLEIAYAYRVYSLKRHFLNRMKYDAEGFLKNKELTEEKILYLYHSHNAYTYSISTIYALNLFAYYLEDPKTFLDKISNSLINDENIKSLFKYYDLDFNSTKIVEEPINLLKKYI